MSGCGTAGCKCGSNCSCGSGCKCGRSDEAFQSTAGDMNVVSVTSASSGDFTSAREDNGCKCGANCNCSNCSCHK